MWFWDLLGNVIGWGLLGVVILVISVPILAYIIESDDTGAKVIRFIGAFILAIVIYAVMFAVSQR